MAETRSITGLDVTVANFEIENNWESELCSLILVKLHIRFVVFGSSAWSSETEVIEPAVCLIGRRARAVANCAQQVSMTAGKRYTSNAMQSAAFSKARPV